MGCGQVVFLSNPRHWTDDEESSGILQVIWLCLGSHLSPPYATLLLPSAPSHCHSLCLSHLLLLCLSHTQTYLGVTDCIRGTGHQGYRAESGRWDMQADLHILNLSTTHTPPPSYIHCTHTCWLPQLPQARDPVTLTWLVLSIGQFGDFVHLLSTKASVGLNIRYDECFRFKERRNA